MLRCGTLFFLSVTGLLLTSPSGFAGPFRNGDFSVPGSCAPFDAWTTSYGDSPTANASSALFTESTQFQFVELEQAFTLPGNLGTIRFDVKITSTPDNAQNNGQNPDSFQATLYDSNFNPYPSQTPPFPAFYFGIDNTQTGFSPSPLVSVVPLGGGTQRVTLDLSGLPPQDVLLEFLLNGSNDGQQTTALLTNVVLTPRVSINAVPEPGSLLLFGSAALSILAYRTLRRPRKTNANCM